MSRQVWMNKTIESARTHDMRLPWQRGPRLTAPRPAPAPVVKIKASA